MHPRTTALTTAEYLGILSTLELVQLYRSSRRRVDGDLPAWVELARRRLVELHGAAFVDALDRD